uniref:ALOG domain-containing protein n=1 Tax=Zea mays TaxID=4577 RepID=B6SQB4_MAIZE|nr:hypothetical protein [Zea mays]
MDMSPNPDSPSSGGGNGIGPSSGGASPSVGSMTPQSPSRYEAQKRRDWNTFGQYLRNHRPPLSLAQCSGAHVLEFLRYLDQFGKTKVHGPGVPLLRPSEPAGAVPLPAPPGLGQPGRPGGPPPRRLRGERGPPGVQPLRGARRAPLPPRGPRAPGPSPRRQLREEEAQEAAAAAGRQQRRHSRPRAPAAATAPAARRRRLLSLS